MKSHELNGWEGRQGEQGSIWLVDWSVLENTPRQSKLDARR